MYPDSRLDHLILLVERNSNSHNTPRSSEVQHCLVVVEEKVCWTGRALRKIFELTTKLQRAGYVLPGGWHEDVIVRDEEGLDGAKVTQKNPQTLLPQLFR
jgi:hypothetical protein